MSYKVIDPSTPFRSDEERTEAMLARNERGEKLYVVDDFYRQSVEAKLMLAVQGEGAPAHRLGRTMVRVDTNGVVSEHTPLRITFNDDDMQKATEVVALRAELTDLEKQVASQERTTPTTIKPYGASQGDPGMLADMGSALYRGNGPESAVFRDSVAARLLITE